MKTTIYQLLGMVKDDKAPKKIMYKEDEFEFNYNINEYIDVHSNSDDKYREFCDRYSVFATLNDEVEILDNIENNKQDKIEKLQYYDNSIMWCMNGREITDNEKDIIDKINEIIEVLNEKQ